MKFTEYSTKNDAEIFGRLESRESGLKEDEVKFRLTKYGFNELKTSRVEAFDIFLRQFRSPFVYLLFIASALAFIAGEKIEGLTILFFVLLNVFLGLFQEFRAEKAVLFLKKYFPEKVRAVRDGGEKILEKRLLAPGDIVLLEAGNIVPADLRLLKTENFLLDESVLTGESVSVPKTANPLSKEAKEIFEASNIAFGGTSVVSGKALGIVFATAKGTALGEIAKLAGGIKRESVYERELIGFSKIILKIVLTTIIFIFIANLLVKGKENLFDFSIFSLALLVSVLPEALPTVVTFAFSQGALRLAKKKVVVKRLSAVNDLGDIEILCADKTGTLTENQLELENIFSYDQEKCLQFGLLASSYLKEKIESSLNPFDHALFQKASDGIKFSLKDYRQIWEIPFDPLRLRNSVVFENKAGERFLVVRGAPEAILKISADFEKQNREELKKEIEKEGRRGRRTLALAFKSFEKDRFSEKDETGLTFLGYFSFRDPLKKTAKEAVSLASKLGVQIKIVTGDSKEVAGQVGKEIGLIDNAEKVILGEALDLMPQDDFSGACDRFSVFARISPATKYKIINSLSKKYEVGFLGEGINDAPALKAAHLAIAVDSAADISREAADIILLKKDLKVLIEGIRNGRNIFSNINKYIKTTISSNFGNFYSIALISLFLPFLPMLPTQILLVNLLSDFPLIAVVSDRVDIDELKKPKLYRLNKFIPLIFLLAFVSSFFDFAFFGIFHKADPAQLQTLWFMISILTEIVLIFSVRSHRFFLKARGPSFILMFMALTTVLITIFLPFPPLSQETFRFAPPSFSSILIVIFLAFNYFSVSEVVKLIYFHYKKNLFANHKNQKASGVS